MIGAFFMSAKRYAEYQKIDDVDAARAYRKSFEYYNAERLLISMVYYITAFGLFLGIFIIRYRMELILSIPFIAGFIAWYLNLTFIKDSPVQYPEKLYKQAGFIMYTLICAAVTIILLFITISLYQ